jgi:fucose 4-O-acetylase-like acetyltransferase
MFAAVGTTTTTTTTTTAAAAAATATSTLQLLLFQIFCHGLRSEQVQVMNKLKILMAILLLKFMYFIIIITSIKTLFSKSVFSQSCEFFIIISVKL